MARRIICTNDDDLSVEFTDAFSPFLLESCDGIYSVKNNVTTSENTMTDGSTYQGSITKLRNIVLTLRDKTDSDHASNRLLLYNLFKPKSLGTFKYVEDDEIRLINYYVESIEVDGENRARQATVSMLCPDPFFTGDTDITVVMAGWEALFTFPHQFVSGGEAIGNRVEELLKTINNTSAADNIGMTITITASGSVTNPTITHVEQNESLTIGTTSNPFNMVFGDKVIITTGTNNKHVYFVHSGTTTEINEYLTESSEFIQLTHGANTIGYSATSGQSFMTVVISFRYRYLGC